MANNGRVEIGRIQSNLDRPALLSHVPALGRPDILHSQETSER
jgi:hypothetical protein